MSPTKIVTEKTLSHSSNFFFLFLTCSQMHKTKVSPVIKNPIQNLNKKRWTVPPDMAGKKVKMVASVVQVSFSRFCLLSAFSTSCLSSGVDDLLGEIKV